MAESYFVPNPAGIREVMKSPGLQAELLSAAQQIAGAASADAYTHAKDLHVSEFRSVPYGAAVDELTNVCVGVAYTRNKLAGINEAKFKSLSSQNH